jgi:murein DD-endopeptidase MepM/ murein hydrolase activator NlpD
MAAALVAILILIPVTAHAEVTQEDLAAANAKVREQSADMEGALADLEEAMVQAWLLEDRVARVQRDISDRERRVRIAEVTARERAVALYMNVGSSRLGGMGSGEDIERVGTRAAYVNALVDVDHNAALELERMREDQERLQFQLEELVLAQEDANAELELRLEQMLADLEAANSEYQALYGQWQIEEAERIRIAEERRRQRAAEERARLARESGFGSSDHISAGGRTCPVAGPHTFRDSWLEPRPGGRQHHGVDMVAASGTPLVAIESGVIWSVGWHWAGGNDLYLRGNSGDLYYYAHLQGYAPGIAAGVAVGKGQVVGYNGATGNASVPHLHLGYQPGGGPLTNPYQLMVKLCR